jgi:hypothetical protein
MSDEFPVPGELSGVRRVILRERICHACSDTYYSNYEDNGLCANCDLEVAALEQMCGPARGLADLDNRTSQGEPRPRILPSFEPVPSAGRIATLFITGAALICFSVAAWIIWR